MKILVTGSSNGIGKSIAKKFVQAGYCVVGFDIQPNPFEDTNIKNNYQHYCVDVRNPESFPDIDDVDIVINNASTNDESCAMETNIKGYMNIAEKYALKNPNLKSILFISSQSAHNGNDLPVYAATKGAEISYMKWFARQVAPRATCNSLSPGPVMTNLNEHILKDEKMFNAVANENLLKTWSSSEEIAEWAFFLTTTNKSATGADFLVDAGESDNFNFIW